MRIKLVMPPRSFAKEHRGMISIPPLGIAYLAAFLKKLDHNVELDDLDIKVISNRYLFKKLFKLQGKYNKDDLENYLLDRRPNKYLDEIIEILLKNLDYKEYDIIGFSIIETSAIDATLLLSKKIKEKTDSKIVLGGECADIKLKQKYNFIDCVIRGQGEYGFLDVINKIKEGSESKGIPPSTIPKQKPDFTSLPFYCYKNVPEKSEFKNPGKILILPYIWSWNCPYQCSFCGNSLNEGNAKLFFKSSVEAAKELKELSLEYNTKYFFILNEYIHLDNKHTMELCNELIKQNANILWCGSGRCNIDTKLISPLFKAGCFYLTFGFESASNKVLKMMKKGYTQEIAEDVIKKVHKTGIWTNLYVIVGFPHENEEDFNETFTFIQKNIDCIDQISVCTFYLVNSDILKDPWKYKIKVREKVDEDKNSSSGIHAYDEIDGQKWEVIREIKMNRVRKLYKLFYIYKKIPEKVLRANTYQLFYAFDKFKDKKRVYDYLYKEYKKDKSKEEGIIYITNKCNNSCLFCKEPKQVVESISKVRKIILDFKKKGINKVTISGGEPTIHPTLFEIVKLIKEKGLEIKLNTNARMLSYHQFCQRLYNEGVRTISVPIYSHESKVHDKVTKVNGSFDQAISGINNWKNLGGKVEIRTLPFKENEEKMSDLVNFILELETVPVY